MSILKVYYPDEPQTEPVVSLDETTPMILPFQRARVKKSHSRKQEDWVLKRARTIFLNQQCSDCGSSAVEKLELRDGLLNQKNRLIPGTATVVGFRCHSCDSEWPA
ncbi:hypothetical protein [Gimesia sp.]|uniref:hypothetical protein n=1 Tax=Gimesia sp. TaxID=2024833 RepID=UPI000C43C073|nr:hypothetical protein [Gimesia sp.]MAX36215.1 hypothetical protein [Gimesia sp.]HAH49668.1 hypothetical protein [Planctomycetaceae bacterium]HBL46835.1 hypothetical protein [Planctomycetaceae bacterium]|tara:strand:- start:7942 stop:8259 length:318 start_codon:yes stop_codon:yes gene_type:complete